MAAGRLVGRAMSALLALTMAASAALAASYSEARDAFDADLTLQQRVVAQVLLNAAGYSLVAPLDGLSPSTYESIKSFEQSNGFAPAGILNDRQLERLALSAAPAFHLWGFETVHYPGRTIAIWVPLGLGLKAREDRAGLHFRDARGRLSLDMLSAEGDDVRGVHDRLMADETMHSASVVHDNYDRGDDWFAISATWPDGSGRYDRFYKDGPRVTGFALAWTKGAEDIHAERIAAIMAGSLRASMANEPFADPPMFVRK